MKSRMHDKEFCGVTKSYGRKNKVMDKVMNAQIRELCGVTKGVDERIDEGVFRWFGQVKRIENC